ncbi:MAG TPA: tRNA (guanine(46)-N(7))-methyltransferase TrmB [Rhizomicrobium sp.]|jgi:tRNA (guanine-N7-)-methyltransferase
MSTLYPRNERRRGLLYGRRKGPKLSGHQAALFQTLLPQLELKLETGRDPRTYFDSPVEDVWLEIGFGGGEHLLWQAQHHPNTGLMGAEPYENGVAKLLSKLSSPSHPPLEGASKNSSAAMNFSGRGDLAASTPPRNLRIHQGDAREIIEALPDDSLGRVFLLFPDPWPKRRHHKRRFIQTETLGALARVMRTGAELRFASDDENYIAWTLERVLAHGAFEWLATCAADWRTRPADWPPTRYEAKALHGVPMFLRVRRRDLQSAGPRRT